MEEQEGRINKSLRKIDRQTDNQNITVPVLKPRGVEGQVGSGGGTFGEAGWDRWAGGWTTNGTSFRAPRGNWRGNQVAALLSHLWNIWNVDSVSDPRRRIKAEMSFPAQRLLRMCAAGEQVEQRKRNTSNLITC